MKSESSIEPASSSRPPDTARQGTARRKTIAVLIDHVDHFGGGYESQLRGALEQAFRKLDANMLVVVGAALEATDPQGAARNGVYELIHPRSVDGVILVSAALARVSGVPGIQRLCAKYSKLPICSLGMAVPNVPSVLLDESSGMGDLVEHLVTQHGRRRIAFIGGPDQNPDAISRLAVSEDVLARHGLLLDRRLLATGEFTVSTGARAMQEILERGVEFDAVVAANDGMALGALEVLGARGLRVPQDVLVTGFDDLPLARFANPPLSTVRQPFQHMTAVAARLVLDQIEGSPVPLCTVLPAEFVARASCGCDARTLERAAASSRQTRVPEAFLREHGERLELRLASALWAHPAGAARRLLAALTAELGGSHCAFQDALELLFREFGPHYELYDDLSQALAELWGELRPGTSELAEIFQDARHLVLLASGRAQARHALDMESTYQRLLRSGERFAAALDVQGLTRLLGEELPSLPTRNASVSLYAGADRRLLEPIFCLEEGEVKKPNVPGFDARELVPPRSMPANRRHTSFVVPLTSDSCEWGVAVIEVGSPFGVHQMIADQVSAALNMLALHREMVRRTALHERSVQERFATAERMNSLSTLAGGVAHDLNNALGPLVALPDTMLAELDELKRDRAYDDAELRADIAAIKSTAVRASQTIKDLLTLGRQGRMSRTVLDLNRVVEHCLEGERLRLSTQRRAGVALEFAIHAGQLPVLASEPHLVRAVSNLVQNGAEALAGGGKVIVRTARVRVDAPRAGYEAVEPGEYAALIVEDDGPGISERTLARVFEPFFTTKPASEQSGSGLGLAIVHGVVKEHEGFVDVQSAVGVGTIFTLFFPLSQAAPNVEEPRVFAPRGSARILVVDDEPLQLRAARRILEQFGYEVSTLSSGQEAYERFLDAARAGGQQQSPCDLVILDMMLGEEHDGLELMRRVRELFPLQRALLMSGHAPAERGRLAEGQGIGWLTKPFGSEALASAVQAALGSTIRV